MDHKAWALAQLREAVGEKRAHRDLLETLIVWHESGRPGGDDNEPNEEGRKGVTFEVASALAADVSWAFNPNRPLNMSPALTYPALRIKQADAARKRTATQTGQTGIAKLENMFAGILGGKK